MYFIWSRVWTEWKRNWKLCYVWIEFDVVLIYLALLYLCVLVRTYVRTCVWFFFGCIMAPLLCWFNFWNWQKNIFLSVPQCICSIIRVCTFIKRFKFIIIIAIASNFNDHHIIIIIRGWLWGYDDEYELSLGKLYGCRLHTLFWLNKCCNRVVVIVIFWVNLGVLDQMKLQFLL